MPDASPAGQAAALLEGHVPSGPSAARGHARWTTALSALVVGVGALPWIAALAGRPSPAMWQLYSTLCHQRPERTLTLLGEPMLVCSRCAGVYAGIALGVALALPRRALRFGRAAVFVALGLAVLDVLTQDLGLHAPWHVARLITGALLGWTASAWMFGTLRATR